MAEVVPGYTTEQAVHIVENNEEEINEVIATNNEDNWIVTSLTLFNSDASVIILFTRTKLLS